MLARVNIKAAIVSLVRLRGTVTVTLVSLFRHPMELDSGGTRPYTGREGHSLIFTGNARRRNRET